MLGDVVESIIGAVFVDSSFDLLKTFAVLDRLYADVLPLLEINNIRDPYSNLVMYYQTLGCIGLKVK